MAYPILAAKGSHLVNRIVVDSENKEIIKVGKKFGAEVAYERDVGLALDNTTHEAVILKSLEILAGAGYEPDVIVLLQATTPFVRSRDIDSAVELLLEGELDSVETVFEVPTIFHPYRVRTIDSGGFTKFFMDQERTEAKRTGIWPKIYAVDSLYCFRPGNLKKFGKIQGVKSKSIIVPRSQACDIDEPIDLIVAEAVLNFNKFNKSK